MKMYKIDSSFIDQIGFRTGYRVSFSSKPRNLLRVIFNDGVTYDYYDVEEETFDRMMKEKSKGSFFHRKIKDKYLNVRVHD